MSSDLLEGMALRSPVRVRVLHLASVALSALLVMGAVVTVQVSLGGPVIAGAEHRPSSDIASAVHRTAPDGTDVEGLTFAGVLVALDRTVVSVAGDIVELRLDNPRGAVADMDLRVQLPGSGADVIGLLVSRMRSDGVEHVRVGSVLTVPGGSLLSIAGSVPLSTAPRPSAAGAIGGADVSAHLSGLTADAGAELRRIETSGARRDGPVQLRATGPITALTDLIGRVEDGPSAPARIRSVRLDRAGPPGAHQLDITFLLRDTSRVALSSGVPDGASGGVRP